jgi:RHS repeat-associated protein
MFITNKANPGWPNINSIFGYDSYNRLKSHVQYYPNNASKKMNYTYDKDGNILTYQKLSSNGTDLTFFTMTYNPTSGRLQNLKKGTTNYSYSFDVNGNIINDYHRQLEISKYNSLNLIKEMRKDNGDGDMIKYDYDESGNRIAKYYQSTKEYYLRDHLGKELAVYDLGHPIKASKFFNLYGANGLAGRIETNYTSEQIYSRGGWITQWFRDDERFYYIKDHLGSIRITVDQNNEITNGQDYLALGSIFREYNIASTNEKYDFTEKERDTETGLNYFGARYYDSDLGRWTSVDPLADKYPGLSPYCYVANNPLVNYDPDGRFIGTLTGLVVGTVAGAVNAYVNNKSIMSGVLEGGTAGAIAGATVDLAVATGGGSLVVMGAAAIGGGLGSASGDIVGQISENMTSGGQEFSQAVGNVDLNQTLDKAKTGTAYGIVGGVAGVAAGKGIQVLSSSTKAVQATMSQNITTTSKILTKMGASQTTINSAVGKISNGMGQAGRNTANSVIKLEAAAEK